jgi:hypothetical protein
VLYSSPLDYPSPRGGSDGTTTEPLVAVAMTRWSRLSRASTAALLIASFVAWRPAMMADMTAMSHQMSDCAHHHDGPQHHSLPTDCCSQCVCCPCAGSLGLPSARTAALPVRSSDVVHPAVDPAGRIVLAVPHRLPFSVGPPLHLA